MYDSINFRLPQERVPSTDLLAEIPVCFDEGSYAEHYGINPFDGKEELRAITGRLGNLNVSVNECGVSVKNSLCKWYLGDNYKTLSRGDTQRAIEKLSDTLHLPMQEANVTRVDFGTTLILQHPVNTYFAHLGTLNHYRNRLTQTNGLYYSNGYSKLAFYDKNKEQKQAGEIIPDLYKGKNVARYEIRYLKRLPKHLGVPEVTGGLLYDAEFYRVLLDRWHSTYANINKLNDFVLNMDVLTTKEQFKKAGLLLLIEKQGGEVAMLEQIDTAKQQGKLTRKQASDIKQMIKSAGTAGELVTPNEDVAELSRKVSDVKHFFS